MLASLLISVLAASGLATSSEPLPATSVPIRLALRSQDPAFQQSATSRSDTTAGTVTGRVQSQLTGFALPFAVVEVLVGSVAISSVTDRFGRYRLESVPPGPRLVRARALDHSELVVGIRVPRGGHISLDLTLAVAPIEMAPLSARTSPVRLAEAAETDPKNRLAAENHLSMLAESERRMLDSSPGVAELGLLQVMQATAGPDATDPSSILYVRGATSDLKLVLLDGAPVYAPFHLGGLIEAFMPNVLGGSRRFIGGAPARYDGGLSYILDLSSRQGRDDRVHTSGALDMMSARADVEGPLPGGSFLMGGRWVHGAGPDRLTGEELPYDYADALVRFDWSIGQSGQLSVTGFFNREAVNLARPVEEPAADDTTLPVDPTADDTTLPADPAASAPELGEVASWGNTAGSLQYRGEAFGSGLELTAAFGEFTTRLPVGGKTPRLVDGRSRRARLAGILSRSIGAARVEFGASFDRVSLAHAARSAPQETETTFSSRATGESVSAHADAALQLAPTLLLRGGLRTEYFFAEGGRLAPRLSAAWQFAEGSQISVSAGRYHQRVLSPETLLSTEIGSFSGIASDDPTSQTASPDAANSSSLQVSSSTHFVVGLNTRPLKQLTIGIEGYIKSFENLPLGPDLDASGIDFWIQRDAAALGGWIGYSVAWYRPQEPFETTRLVGRHLVTGGLSAQLISGIGLDVNFAYGTALPFTKIPQSEDEQSGSLGGGSDGGTEGLQPAGRLSFRQQQEPPALVGTAQGTYLRLDGTIYRTWILHLSGVTFSISPYLKLLNALDRRDALFFQFNPDEDSRPVSLGAVPFIPLVGVRWGL